MEQVSGDQPQRIDEEAVGKKEINGLGWGHTCCTCGCIHYVDVWQKYYML